MTNFVLAIISLCAALYALAHPHNAPLAIMALVVAIVVVVSAAVKIIWRNR